MTPQTTAAVALRFSDFEEQPSTKSIKGIQMVAEEFKDMPEHVYQDLVQKSQMASPNTAIGIDEHRELVRKQRKGLEKLNIEERRVIETWMAISEQQGRDMAGEIAGSPIEIEAAEGYQIDREFMTWAIRNLTREKLQAMKASTGRGLGFTELLDAAGISWRSFDKSIVV